MIDELLRDKIQSPSEIHPTVDQKSALLEAMGWNKIAAVALGVFGTESVSTVTRLIEEISDQDVYIKPIVQEKQSLIEQIY